MYFNHQVAHLPMPAINQVAGWVSLKVVRRSTPNRDFPAFFAHLHRFGIEFASVIDVGIAFGSPTLYAFIPKGRFYVVAPVPSCKPLLDQLAQRLGAQTFNVATGAQDGAMDFSVHPDVSGSSAYRQHEGEYFDGQRVTVPVRRLDSIIPTPLPRPSLLKIDTQRTELEVLAGATGLIDLIDIVIVEVSFHEFRRGTPEFHDIALRMVDLGFRGDEILESYYRAGDGALAYVHAALVRSDSVLRTGNAFFTRSQANRHPGARS